MHHLDPCPSIARATVFMLLACASRVALCQGEGETITITLPDDVPLEMVHIPAGSFEMGSPDTEVSRGHDEGPVHTVTIDYDFYFGKYVVTQAQWEALMASNPSGFGGNPDRPVETISWDDCQQFILALNAFVAQTDPEAAVFRLPSESEWEFACRAGTTTQFYFGDSDCSPMECTDCELSNHGWWCGNNGPLDTPTYGTKAVGRLSPNAWGLYDMTGNVWEWCEDFWHENYDDPLRPDNGSPWLTPTTPYRVVRGGAWNVLPQFCRSADRLRCLPDLRFDDTGFRLARTQTSTPTPTPTPPPTPPPTPTPTSTPTPTPTPTSTPIETHIFMLPGDVPLDMVRIPAGSFLMGSNDDSNWSWCYPCEQPVHRVNIDYDSYMGKYEVTQAQWEAVMGDNPSRFDGNPNHPVEQVSWDDIQIFVSALNTYLTDSGQGPAIFRLPSEAEWEYACRAGTQTRFSFGDSDCSPTESPPCSSCELDDYGWWCGNADNQTYQVGQKPPNAWGLYDMHGNLWEWCEDYWHGSYDDASRPDDGSPWLDPWSSFRVVRSGNWIFTAQNCRSAFRRWFYPDFRISYIGLRLAMTRENKADHAWRMYK